MLGNWQREHTMEDILTGLKREMSTPQNRRLHQPQEGIFPFHYFRADVLRMLLNFSYLKESALA
jgi:hypothetical protein